MPRTKEPFSVHTEERTEGETRIITATVMGAIQDFQLTDLLRQRGAIPGIEGMLKQAMREAVVAYLESAEDLIAGIAAGQKKAVNGTKAKVKDAPVSGSNGAVNGAVNRVTNGAVKGGESEAGKGAGNGHLGAMVSSVVAGDLANGLVNGWADEGNDVLALQ